MQVDVAVDEQAGFWQMPVGVLMGYRRVRILSAFLVIRRMFSGHNWDPLEHRALILE